MTEDEMMELERMVRPLTQYLQNNRHPYTAIVVTAERVTVIEATACIPTAQGVSTNAAVAVDFVQLCPSRFTGQ